MNGWIVLLIFIGLAIVGLLAVTAMQGAWVAILSRKPYASPPPPPPLDKARE